MSIIFKILLTPIAMVVLLVMMGYYTAEAWVDEFFIKEEE